MKKTFAVIILTLMTFSLFSMQAFAITKDEYIQYMKDKGFAQEYIIYVQNHFKSYNYTPAQLDTLKMYSDKVLDIVMPKNPDVVTKGGNYFNKNLLTQADRDQILDYVVKAAAALNIRAVFTRGPDTIRYIEFYNQKGDKIGDITLNYNSLKYTANPFGSTSQYLGMVVLLIAVLGVGTLIIKKTLYVKKVA